MLAPPATDQRILPIEHAANTAYFLTGIFACVAPKTLAGVFPMLALLAIMHLVASRRALWDLTRVAPATVLFAIYFGLAALSALWAKNPEDALVRGLYSLGAVLSAHVLIFWSRNNIELASRAVRWLIFGISCGALFMLFETLSGQWLERLVLGDILNKPVNLFQLNLHITAANLLFWPAALMTALHFRRPLLAGVLLAIVLVATYASEHETSKLAIILSALVFGLAYAAPRLARVSLIAGWVAAVTLILPLSIYCHQTEKLDRAEWLQGSAQHRIVIWGNIASRTLEAPLLGHGVRSIYQMNLDDKAAGKGADVLGREAIPPHAHNVYLQTWFELGAAGALIMGLFGFALLRETVPQRAYPFIAAGSAAGMVEILPSFEIWQNWFVALLALSIVANVMAQSLIDRDKRSPL